MLALSINQPWASLIIHAGKDIENRDWLTKVRGRVAVHASKRLDKDEMWRAHCLFRQAGLEIPDSLQAAIQSLQDENLYGKKFAPPESYPLGAIIGTVDIVDCVTKSDSPWFFGPHGFVLRDPIALPEPVPCKGALSFWKVPEGLL